ncbi:hypothetical protein D3C72_778600 [compost metagenome]
MHGFDLEDFDFLRVGDDVVFGGFVADARFQRDQTGLGQQLQTTAAVDRVVGDGDAGAFGQLIKAFVFFRIETDVVDDPRCERHQIKTRGGFGVFEERDVLEVVHVDVAGGEADVGCDPVSELHQLDVQALSGGFFYSGFQRDGEGCGGADFQRSVGGENGRAEQAEGQGQCFDWVGQAFLGHDGFSSQCINFVVSGRASSLASQLPQVL